MALPAHAPGAGPVEDQLDAKGDTGTKLLFTFGNLLGKKRCVELARTFEDQGEVAALKCVTVT